MRNIWKSGPVRLAIILLLGQAALLYSSIHPEAIPEGKALVNMPQTLAGWHSVGPDGVIEPEVMEVLKADDLLSRQYARDDGKEANLYIAAFRSQRNGKAPHSPKNCLPGSGWTPILEQETAVDVGEAAPIVVNHYVVAHGDAREMVMYWYQSRGRVVANEYKAKFWVIADALRYNRTDTAIVRVIVRIDNKDNAAAQVTGEQFIKTFYPAVRAILPQ